MTEIIISKEQFDNFIKSVERVLYDVIVNDKSSFNYMLGGCFNGFSGRQEVAIMGTLEYQLKNLIDYENRDTATCMAYIIWTALDSAVVGLQSLHTQNNYTPEEVYEFCKDTLHWLLGIDNSPCMFETLFDIVYVENDEDPTHL